MSEKRSEKRLVIATRKSALAMWQAEYVKAELESLHAELHVELLGMTTQGDKILDVPLAKVGGKGLFVKELETALLSGDADIAVHSMKDVPMDFPEGLGLGAVLKREAPTDAFVSNRYAAVDALPQGSKVGTSSLRRQCQLSAHRPDLEIIPLRGNVNTRLRKLDDGEYDAIILASSGLKRLGFASRIRHELQPDFSLPAVGQGALGIECRLDDQQSIDMINPLIDERTTTCLAAERAMNKRLQGGCQVPIAGFAELIDSGIRLRGLVGAVDGKQILTAEGEYTLENAEALGIRIAEELLRKGADKILKAIYGETA